jgi:hypothetical protein
MDPAPDPDLTSDARMQKKNFIFFLIISYNFPQANYLCYFCKHYFNPLNTFMRNLGKNPDPRDPKTCGSGCPTLSITVFVNNVFMGKPVFQIGS